MAGVKQLIVVAREDQRKWRMRQLSALHPDWAVHLHEDRLVSGDDEIRVLVACRDDERVRGLEFQKLEIDPLVPWMFHAQYKARHRP